MNFVMMGEILLIIVMLHPPNLQQRQHLSSFRFHVIRANCQIVSNLNEYCYLFKIDTSLRCSLYSSSPSLLKKNLLREQTIAILPFEAGKIIKYNNKSTVYTASKP